MRILTTTIMTLALAAVAACGKPSAADVEKLAKECAACKDKACAEKVQKKAEKKLEGLKPSDLDEKMMGAMLELGFCVAKFEMGDLMGGE